MAYALICSDKPGALQTRMDNRPPHVAHLEAHADKLVYAGPFLDDDGNPCGSLIVLDVETQAEAEAFAAADPYSKAGLFAEVKIQPTRQVFPKR